MALSKLQDVLELFRTVECCRELFGVNPYFMDAFEEKYRQIGERLAYYHGLTPEQATRLPPETELSVEAEWKLQQLRLWLASRHPSFPAKNELWMLRQNLGFGKKPAPRRQFAKLFGVDIRAVRAWERGTACPDRKTYEKILLVQQVTLEGWVHIEFFGEYYHPIRMRPIDWLDSERSVDILVKSIRLQIVGFLFR